LSTLNAYISEFPDCCGIDIVSGFEYVGYGCKAWDNDAVLKQTSQKAIEDKIKDHNGPEYWDNEQDQYVELGPDDDYPAGPGLILLALNESQYTKFADAIKINKFKLLSEFVNPNTGNRCRLYGRKRKQPKRTKKGLGST
jgi:hypothetical protein